MMEFLSGETFEILSEYQYIVEKEWKKKWDMQS